VQLDVATIVVLEFCERRLGFFRLETQLIAVEARQELASANRLASSISSARTSPPTLATTDASRSASSAAVPE
jgi:hypothetical protein